MRWCRKHFPVRSLQKRQIPSLPAFLHSWDLWVTARWPGMAGKWQLPIFWLRAGSPQQRTLQFQVPVQLHYPQQLASVPAEQDCTCQLWGNVSMYVPVGPHVLTCPRSELLSVPAASPSLWVLPANARLDGTKRFTETLRHLALGSGRPWYQYGTMVGHTSSGARVLEIWSWLCRFPALWAWAHHFTSLRVVGWIMLSINTSQSCCEWIHTKLLSS